MHPPNRRFGLRTRLVALVLAPAIVLALVGGGVALRERNAAIALAEVRDEAEVLSRLTDLRSVLLDARAPVEISVRAGTLGIDQGTALRLLDLEDFSSSDLDQVNAQLMRLPPGARPFTVADLERLGEAADSGADPQAIDQFDRLDEMARDTWDRRFDTLRGRVTDTGSATLDLRLDDLEAATNAGSSAGIMVTKLADYWFSFVGDGSRAAPARSELTVASRQFDRAMVRLQASQDPGVVAQATTLMDELPDSTFDQGVRDAVEGRPPAPFTDGRDIELIAATFSSSFDLFGPLYELMSGRSEGLQASATSLADEATRTAVITLGGVVLAIAIMLAISVTVAASFERPLSRLIEATRRVGSGDLTMEPLPTDGPAEIREATAAFNDVVANLRLLGGKVDALANADLDDPRLSQPLPGELGDAMERSMRLLSDSIGERTRLEERLAFQATHDALTTLPNRLGALEALEGAMARARRTGSRLAVAFLDLDGFKQVNDNYGHLAGDTVLQEVARRLDLEARAGDYCARLGGDEFVIIAEDVANDEGALALGRRIAAAIEAPVTAGSATITVGVSIGIAFRIDGEDPLHLLDRADAAAYRAKRARSVVELSHDRSPT